MDEKKEIEELAEILKQAFYKSSEVHSNEIREALKNGAKHYGSRDFKKSMFDYMAEAVILGGYRKAEDLTPFEKFLLNELLHSKDDCCKICTRCRGLDLCDAFSPNGEMDEAICYAGIREYYESHKEER